MIADYVLTERDIKGPYIEKLPAKMEDMKSLKALSYTGPKEALSERFHMSQDLLAALNPDNKRGVTLERSRRAPHSHLAIAALGAAALIAPAAAAGPPARSR